MLRSGLKTLAAMALTTALSLAVSRMGVGNESIIMVFLLGVLGTAVLTSSRGWAIGAALLCSVLFNFFFTEPLHTLFVDSANDIMLLGFFLITGIVSGTVTSRLQNEMLLVSQNERTAKILYRIVSGFLSASGRESVVKKAEALVAEYAGLACSVRLDGGGSGLPITAGEEVLGWLELPDGVPDGQQLLILRAVCTQLGIALERETLVADREKIRLSMEREQQRSALLRSVAHDLRTPLTALSGAGTLLADDYDTLSDAQRRKLAADLSEEMVWLTDLVENILSMTRITEGKILLRKQDEVIDDVIGEAVKHTERLLGSRRLCTTLPDEVVTAPMDGKLIVQVLINLLENAIRHTQDGSEIALTVTVGEAALLVSVADWGEGIAQAVRGRLFQRFVTEEGKVADGRRGLGLGLSICKAIVEAHGGQIFAADNAPRGAVFTFTLPMEDAYEGEADHPHH